jgi:hypothetical protein
MNSNPPKFPDSSAHHSSSSQLIRTHSEMLAAEAEASAAKRRLELEELRSELNTPEQRIRAWERVHGLTLPRNPKHRILGAIALETRLTLEQVLAVQRNDAERRVVRAAP